MVDQHQKTLGNHPLSVEKAIKDAKQKFCVQMDR